MKRELPTCAYLHDCFHLDKEKWILVRKRRPDEHFETSAHKRGWEPCIGTQCISRNGGELSVKLDGRTYLQKHIVFKMVHGRHAEKLWYKDNNPNNLNPNNLVELQGSSGRSKFENGRVVSGR